MDFNTIQDELEQFIEDKVLSECTAAQAEHIDRWPLDPRARPYGGMWFSDDVLIVKTDSVRVLDYYGGFEYIESENRQTIGNYTVFSNENGRVSQVIDALKGEPSDDEDEE